MYIGKGQSLRIVMSSWHVNSMIEVILSFITTFIYSSTITALSGSRDDLPSSQNCNQTYIYINISVIFFHKYDKLRLSYKSHKCQRSDSRSLFQSGLALLKLVRENKALLSHVNVLLSLFLSLLRWRVGKIVSTPEKWYAVFLPSYHSEFS